MLESLKKSWRELSKDEPGKRFHNRYERAQKNSGKAHRAVTLSIGILLVLVGIVLLVIPGPGSVFLVVGGAMIAEESKKAARALDRTELWTRAWLKRLTRRGRQAKARLARDTSR